MIKDGLEELVAITTLKRRRICFSLLEAIITMYESICNIQLYVEKHFSKQRLRAILLCVLGELSVIHILPTTPFYSIAILAPSSIDYVHRTLPWRQKQLLEDLLSPFPSKMVLHGLGHVGRPTGYQNQ